MRPAAIVHLYNNSDLTRAILSQISVGDLKDVTPFTTNGDWKDPNLF
jgi:hypothetical protein